MAEPPDPHAAPRAGEDVVGPHGAADEHVGEQGHDDHAQAGIALGPIDVQRWGATAIGVLLGLVVVLALMQSLS